MAIGHSSLPRKIFCNILTAFYTLKLYISTLLVSCGLYWKTSAGGIHPVLRQIWDDIQSHLKKFSIFMCSLYDYLMNCLDICFMNYQDKSSNELTKSISSSRLKIIAQSSIIVGKNYPKKPYHIFDIMWFADLVKAPLGRPIRSFKIADVPPRCWWHGGEMVSEAL